MAIEGIGSAVGSTYTPKVSKPSTDITIAENTSASNIKVETPVPKAEGKGKDFSDSRDKDQEGKYGAQVQTDGKEATTDQIKSAVDTINQQTAMKHTNCSFKYHEDTNRISITVKDTDTDEVIREIPAEKALDMLAKAWELAGLMVDEKR